LCIGIYFKKLRKTALITLHIRLNILKVTGLSLRDNIIPLNKALTFFVNYTVAVWRYMYIAIENVVL